MRENDAFSAAFDVEASDIFRRTPADLTLGGLNSTSGECCGHTVPPRSMRCQRLLLAGWSKQLRRGRRGNGAGGLRLGPRSPSGPCTTPISKSQLASALWSSCVPMGPAVLAHLPPLAQCVARLWNHWLTMLSCAVVPKCHGDTTTSPRCRPLCPRQTKNAEFPPGAPGRCGGPQPCRRVADPRGAPKAPRMRSRRNIGMHGEACPIGLREPRPLGANRHSRAGATGTTEGRPDGRVTQPAFFAGSASYSSEGTWRWCSQHWSSPSRSQLVCSLTFQLLNVCERVRE